VKPLLTVEGLRVEFGSEDPPLVAVDGAGLTVHPGEVVGLIGESGSGKSLTCRAVMRLIPRPGRVAAGRIEFDGQDVLGMSAGELREFRAHEAGMIYQDPFSSLNPVLRIRDQIAETLRVNLQMSKAQARSHAVELLDGVGIPEPERRALAYPHELSGGMRQRVMIALATASRPRLLLADEPTTALDVTTQAQILELIRRLQQERGLAVILITHDMGVIAEMTDDVVVMYLGHEVEKGPVDAIFHAPRHPYTRSLLRSIPSVLAEPLSRLATIAGSIPHPYARPSGCPFHPRCPEAIAGVCEKTFPDEVAIADQHDVACHLYVTATLPAVLGPVPGIRRGTGGGSDGRDRPDHDVGGEWT
jgi:oligopeptide/dipeptide ABC transporter ATP-binding protein